MKSLIISLTSAVRIFIIVFFWLAIAFTPWNSVLADTVKSNVADATTQAAQEVVKDTGVKEQFGKTKNGEKFLDRAKQKASNKLNQLGNKARSQQESSASEKLFLDNLKGKDK